jgi:hypothetical protein
MAVAAALRALKTLDQLPNPVGRLKTKLGAKECPVTRELAHRLRLVALGQVHLDEGNMAAFPKWLGSHGRAGCASGFTPAASTYEAAG